MLTPLRAEVNALLAQTPVRRKPALRRSDAVESLLATDLPFAAEEDAVADFTAKAEAVGWRISRAENGWLMLDKPVPVPSVDLPSQAEGECGCCISLLVRHPDEGDAKALIRDIVRAEEAGVQAFDQFCLRLHEDLATRLRLHQPLPGALTPYLAHACNTFSDRRK